MVTTRSSQNNKNPFASPKPTLPKTTSNKRRSRAQNRQVPSPGEEIAEDQGSAVTAPSDPPQSQPTSSFYGADESVPNTASEVLEDLTEEKIGAVKTSTMQPGGDGFTSDDSESEDLTGRDMVPRGLIGAINNLHRSAAIADPFSAAGNAAPPSIFNSPQHTSGLFGSRVSQIATTHAPVAPTQASGSAPQASVSAPQVFVSANIPRPPAPIAASASENQGRVRPPTAAKPTPYEARPFRSTRRQNMAELLQDGLEFGETGEYREFPLVLGWDVKESASLLPGRSELIRKTNTWQRKGGQHGDPWKIENNDPTSDGPFREARSWGSRDFKFLKQRDLGCSKFRDCWRPRNCDEPMPDPIRGVKLQSNDPDDCFPLTLTEDYPLYDAIQPISTEYLPPKKAHQSAHIIFELLVTFLAPDRDEEGNCGSNVFRTGGAEFLHESWPHIFLPGGAVNLDYRPFGRGVFRFSEGNLQVQTILGKYALCGDIGLETCRHRPDADSDEDEHLLSPGTDRPWLLDNHEQASAAYRVAFNGWTNGRSREPLLQWVDVRGTNLEFLLSASSTKYYREPRLMTDPQVLLVLWRSKKSSASQLLARRFVSSLKNRNSDKVTWKLYCRYLTRDGHEIRPKYSLGRSQGQMSLEKRPKPQPTYQDEDWQQPSDQAPWDAGKEPIDFIHPFAFRKAYPWATFFPRERKLLAYMMNPEVPHATPPKSFAKPDACLGDPTFPKAMRDECMSLTERELQVIREDVRASQEQLRQHSDAIRHIQQQREAVMNFSGPRPGTFSYHSWEKSAEEFLEVETYLEKALASQVEFNRRRLQEANEANEGQEPLPELPLSDPASYPRTIQYINLMCLAANGKRLMYMSSAESSPEPEEVPQQQGQPSAATSQSQPSAKQTATDSSTTKQQDSARSTSKHQAATPSGFPPPSSPLRSLQQGAPPPSKTSSSHSNWNAARNPGFPPPGSTSQRSDLDLGSGSPKQRTSSLAASVRSLQDWSLYDSPPSHQVQPMLLKTPPRRNSNAQTLTWGQQVSTTSTQAPSMPDPFAEAHRPLQHTNQPPLHGSGLPESPQQSRPPAGPSFTMRTPMTQQSHLTRKENSSLPGSPDIEHYSFTQQAQSPSQAAFFPQNINQPSSSTFPEPTASQGQPYSFLKQFRRRAASQTSIHSGPGSPTIATSPRSALGKHPASEDSESAEEREFKKLFSGKKK